MHDISRTPAAQARLRALIIPREHGAWGLLFIPLFTGIATGIFAAHRAGPVLIWPIAVFVVASLALFWLRTPVESLLGVTAATARSHQERLIASLASFSLATLAAVCLTLLLRHGHNRQVLLIGAIAAGAFLLQAILRRLGRSTRMAAQVVGAAGLTSTAAAAYYLATGRLNECALALWIANWLFAGNQIHFVQLRIHAARCATFAQKFAAGRIFLIAQPAVLVTLGFASFWHWMPALVIVAFLPAAVRGVLWFFRGPQPLDVRRLGWSEVRYGIVFGILLTIAFCLS